MLYPCHRRHVKCYAYKGGEDYQKENRARYCVIGNCWDANIPGQLMEKLPDDVSQLSFALVAGWCCTTTVPDQRGGRVLACENLHVPLCCAGS